MITGDMSIQEIIRDYPATVEVFEKYRLGCLRCMAASFESLEEGLKAHGLDVEGIVRELNRAVEPEA
jgi:hybrid cluster-associated redox disulfide protein